MERAEIHIEGRGYRIVRLVGEEALLGAPFRYQAWCEIADDAPAPTELVGATATVVVRDGFANERRIAGMVASARRSFNDAGVLLELTVRPAVARLDLGRDHRMFADASALEVIERIFEEAGERLRVELAVRPQKREAIAQFDESDLALFDRLVDDEGWVWWLDHDDDSIAVLADDVRGLPFLQDERTLRVSEDSHGRHTDECLHGLELHERSSVDAVRVQAADRDVGGPASPDSPATSRLIVGQRGRGRYQRVEYAGSSHGRPDVDGRAGRLFEALTAERRRIRARSTSVRPYPGRALVIAGAPGIDGEYVVVGLSLTIEQLRRGDVPTVEHVLSCEIELHPREVPLRLWRAKRAPTPMGVQLADIVGEREIAIDGDGRVPTRVRWDRSGAGVRPARVAQRPTAGAALYPRVGWNVLTLPERGALDEPTVLGRLFDAEHPPPYALPGDKTKLVYKTGTSPGGGSSNEISFDGALGGEEMYVHASGDLGSAANNNDGERVEGDATRAVGRDEKLAVKGDDNVAIEGDLAMTIGNNEALEIAGGHGTAVDGDMSEKIGATRSLHVGKEHALTVAGKRSQRVGALALDATLGPIKTQASSSASVLTGGARVKVALGAVTETAMVGSAMLVGGVRIDIGKTGILIESKSSIRERVGGAVIMRAVRRWHQFALSYGSYKAATVKLEATDITVAGTGRILCICGKSSIRVDADGVEIRGTNITATGAMWVAEGNPQTTWR